MELLKKILVILLSIITPFLVNLSHEPEAKYDEECQAVLEKTDGFIKGVCHTDKNYEMVKEANIGWTRKDIPFPYNAYGGISIDYIMWKAEMQEYVDNGIKVFAITPYPEDYIEYGLDPRDASSREDIQEIARFYVEDLIEIVSAFQVTNEMGIDRFTLPLTMDEAAEFIGMQLEAMYPLTRDTDIIIGYNMAVVNFDLPFRMLKWNDYLDYVGIDLYLGSFEDICHDIDQYLGVAGIIRKVTNKPIIFCEFGYMGYGESLTDEEQIQVLQKYGYSSEEEATADMDNFLQKLPYGIKAEIFELYPDYTAEEYAEVIFHGEYMNHFYCSLPENYRLDGYPHTPEGQGKFFEDLIPKLRDLDYVVGTIVYCWQDSAQCYVCGQATCPVETGWGLVDGQGNPKPSYYAVQKAFED